MKVIIEFEMDIEGDHEDVDLVKEYFNLVDRSELVDAIYRGDIEVDRCDELNKEIDELGFRISKLEHLLDEAGISYE